MGRGETAVLVMTAWVLGCSAGPAQAAAPAPQAAAAEKEAYQNALQDADALVKSGEPERAYALLRGYEQAHAGEARFDYLLGIAALDSGKPDLATLAFERVLMSDPGFTGARLEMARAYYQLGDLLRAEVEFERVAHENPPPGARATVRKYLEAIAARNPRKKTHYAAYVEATAGRDTNVNNSTSQQQVIVNIPTVGPVVATLNATSLKAADNYGGLGAGGELSHTLNPHWAFYAGADLLQRDYHTQQDFNALTAEGRAGVMYGANAEHVRFGVNGGEYTLGGRRNRSNAAVNAEWARTLSPRNQVLLFGQYQQYRFADYVMQVDNFNQQVAGAGWTHALGDGRSVLSGFAYYGAEQDISTIITTATPDGGRTDGAKRLGGLRVGGQTMWGGRTMLYANAGWQAGLYSRVNPLFLVQRSDRYVDLAMGAVWQWNPSWSLSPQLAHAHNSSNIPVYSYSRTDLSLTLRRDFR
ncbi:MAG TPA: tetratricopeptide repeat protein [Gallionellaceae bacterium]|nr:tetratricopeptide repeat protein [Gallionellaceae bacterium]